MIISKYVDTLKEVIGFTQDLESDNSVVAIDGMKPIWRIMKSIQMKHVPDLEEQLLTVLDRTVSKLEIRDVAPTSYSIEESIGVLDGFIACCGFRHEDLASFSSVSKGKA